ncbi:MAG: hypothetical protein EON47_00290 [Acetobacteraceae bacterium]|nr:MAG: hypothetical protein EON47_00290 [Acetobacteraceae bacterium]
MAAGNLGDPKGAGRGGRQLCQGATGLLDRFGLRPRLSRILAGVHQLGPGPLQFCLKRLRILIGQHVLA